MAADWNGYPPTPQISGWHMLRRGDETAAYWNADKQHWEQGGIFCGGSGLPKFLTSKHFGAGVQYIGPLIAVADRDRLLAVVEAAEAEARRYAGHYAPHSDGRNTFLMLADRIATLRQEALDAKDNADAP